MTGTWEANKLVIDRGNIMKIIITIIIAVIIATAVAFLARNFPLKTQYSDLNRSEPPIDESQPWLGHDITGTIVESIDYLALAINWLIIFVVSGGIIYLAILLVSKLNGK